MRTNTERFALWGALGVLGAVGLGGAGSLQSAVERARGPSAGVAAPAAAVDTGRLALEAARGELAVAQLRIERADAIIGYSTRYRITADLAAAIYDLALAEGIEPALAFSLVRTESNFTPTAESPAGAIGYTQILLSTARLYEPEPDGGDGHANRSRLTHLRTRSQSNERQGPGAPGMRVCGEALTRVASCHVAETSH